MQPFTEGDNDWIHYRLTEIAGIDAPHSHELTERLSQVLLKTQQEIIGPATSTRGPKEGCQEGQRTLAEDTGRVLAWCEMIG